MAHIKFMPWRVLERARTRLHVLRQRLRLQYWFPHFPLALLLIIGGLWMLRDNFGGQWHHYLQTALAGGRNMPPSLLPSLLISGGLVTMALGLLWRSRVAWLMALLLTTAAIVTDTLLARHGVVLPVYFLLVLVAMLIGWRSFDRASLAGGTLFAVTAVLMVMGYATFGSFYLGEEFRPPIGDLVTALYYSMVTMSTVGYGDIAPTTPEAKLFAVSVIVLGLTVFATSLTAVVAPLMSRSLERFTARGKHKMKREKHFVVVGNSALAVNTSAELAKRGRPVTRILRAAPTTTTATNIDTMVGDPGNREVLLEAGADRAAVVLAMTGDDSENAFIVLAVKELNGSARTVAAINDASTGNRVRLVQPDLTISPQVLGGELMAMVLSGEEISPDYVISRVLQGATDLIKPGAAAP
ncbi:MAG: ion channel [Sinobacteraceae bacterium]|nr:ion channel [Nevskiaceae bacterium]